MDGKSTFAITRPHESLMTYYVFKALSAGPGFPIMLLVLYFRYHSMRYRFDEEGISMSWGILFRHEIVLNYSRIQDVHLNSNAIERWLGLAKIEVQTASGGSAQDMTIEGLLAYESVRDFLYSRMRGAKPHPAAKAAADPAQQTLAGALQGICAELRAIRGVLEERKRV